MFRVNDDGKRSSHTLVPASRNYNNGQRTAVHSRVRACRRGSFCKIMYSVSESFYQYFTDTRAVIVIQTLFGYGGIVFDLFRDNPVYIPNFYCIRKFGYVFYV